MRLPIELSAIVVLTACATTSPTTRSTEVIAVPPSSPPSARTRAIEAFSLPGAVPPVSLDFLFYEPQRARIWVPAGGTGNVAVFDIAKRAFTPIPGFGTVERESHGKTRVLGPSSGAVGQGVAYVGNRATSEICSVDLQTLTINGCTKLAESPDCVEYVGSTRELWVTTPNNQSIVILDTDPAAQLKEKARVTVPGAPEGYAVDEQAGVFLTNLEDKGSTLRIDLKTRAIRDTWAPGCSAEGPRGVAVDPQRQLVMVACTDHVQILDAAHGGAPVGRVETGAGVDNITYVPATHLLFAAAGKAARLTVASIDAGGKPTIVATTDTAPGARNTVVDESGDVYLANAQAGGILLVHGAAQLPTNAETPSFRRGVGGGGARN